MDWCLVPLRADHRRANFDCGEELLNEFLRTVAPDDPSNQVWIVSPNRHSPVVLGFYVTDPDVAYLEDEAQPGRVISYLRLEYFAIDLSLQGRGLGTAVLENFIFRTFQVAARHRLGMLVFYPVSQRARDWYLTRKFVKFVAPEDGYWTALYLFFETDAAAYLADE